MGGPIKGLTTSLDLITRIPNKKQKSKFSINDITNQYLRQFINKFKNSPYLDYKQKHVHNESTDAYFFQIKQITKTIEIKNHIQIRTKGVKSNADKKRTNKTI